MIQRRLPTDQCVDLYVTLLNDTGSEEVVTAEGLLRQSIFLYIY